MTVRADAGAPRPIETDQTRRRAARRGVLAGALLPPALMGGGAAILLAAAQQPFAELLGIGRWHVFAPFAASGLALNLWIIGLIPALPACWALCGPAGLPARRAAAVAAASAAALATVLALISTGGGGGEALLRELRTWGVLCSGASALSVACMTVGSRLAARRWTGAAA